MVCSTLTTPHGHIAWLSCVTSLVILVVRPVSSHSMIRVVIACNSRCITCTASLALTVWDVFGLSPQYESLDTTFHDVAACGQAVLVTGASEFY